MAPAPSEYKSGATPLPPGLHLLKINTNADLDDKVRLQYRINKGKPQWVIPSYNAEGSVTDFIPNMDSTIFRLQFYIAAVMGKTWKKEEAVGDDTAKFIYDKLLPTSDPRKVSNWVRVFNQFENLDTENGRKKFIEWFIKQAEKRPFWAVLRTHMDQNGQMSSYPEIAVKGGDNIRACEDSEINNWRAPGSSSAPDSSASESAPDDL